MESGTQPKIKTEIQKGRASIKRGEYLSNVGDPQTPYLGAKIQSHSPFCPSLTVRAAILCPRATLHSAAHGDE